MRRTTLVSVAVVAFIIGSALGFFVLPRPASQQTYALAFVQAGACSGPMYGAPWSVALDGHTTIAAPPNAPLPIPNNRIEANASNAVYSTIWFHLPNGIYPYVIAPTGFFPNGTVTVNGADQIVTVYGPLIDCITTTT